MVACKPTYNLQLVGIALYKKTLFTKDMMTCVWLATNNQFVGVFEHLVCLEIGHCRNTMIIIIFLIIWWP